MSGQQEKQDKTTQPRRRGPGRNPLRTRPDFRLTVRFRYHCDQDLILALQRSPNKNKLLRDALRRWLLEEQENVSE